MIPLRALMVDLDGTLARTAAANVRAYAQALEEHGVSISASDLNMRVEGRHWRQFLPTILMEAGSQHDPTHIATRKAEIYKRDIDQIEINLGLVHLLRASRPSLHTALVTSAARMSVEALLRAHDLTGLFDIIVTGDDVQQHKPDPEAYWTAAKQLNVSPEETLIYEDSDIGVQSAKAFGGHVIRIIF